MSNLWRFSPKNLVKALIKKTKPFKKIVRYLACRSSSSFRRFHFSKWVIRLVESSSPAKKW
jgi:hypothetical protein